MIKVNDALTFDFDNLEIDSFWNVGNEKENKAHRIHSYPAKFPAFITQKAIEYARNSGIEVGSIADFFCGCGTVAYEAKRLGIDFWGCDLNPVAVLIAKTKSNNYSKSKIDEYYQMILHDYIQSIEGFSTGEGYKGGNLLSLAGVYQPKKEIEKSKVPIALSLFLEKHPEVTTIYLHLDNDKTGRICTKALQNILKERAKVVDMKPPVGKDVNDFLMFYLGKRRNFDIKRSFLER